MPKLRLTDADRERLGCPEFIDITTRSITNREAVVLQKLGYPTPVAFARALESETVDYEAWTALVWLALRRAGVETDPATLEFDAFGFRVFLDEPPVAPKDEPGKARGRGPSTSSPRKRSTRGATSKAKLTPTASPS